MLFRSGEFLIAAIAFEPMSWWEIIACMLGVYFVIVPLLVMSYFWMSADPDVRSCFRRDTVAPPVPPTVPSSPPPPSEVEAFFRIIEEEISRIGFHPVGWFVIHRMVVASDAYLAIFHNEQEQDSATALAAIGNAGSIGEVRSYSVEIATTGVDGRLWETSNVASLPGLPDAPYRTVRRFPGLTDLRVLYDLHRSLRQLAGQVSRHKEWESDLSAEVTNTILRETQELCKMGYLRLNRSKLRYRMRLRGVPYCVIGLLWPISMVRRYLVRRRAQALMASVGHFGGYERGDYKTMVARRLNDT